MYHIFFHPVSPPLWLWYFIFITYFTLYFVYAFQREHISSIHKDMIDIMSKCLKCHPIFSGLFFFFGSFTNSCIQMWVCFHEYAYSLCHWNLLSLNFLFIDSMPLMKTKQISVNLHFKTFWNNPLVGMFYVKNEELLLEISISHTYKSLITSIKTPWENQRFNNPLLRATCIISGKFFWSVLFYSLRNRVHFLLEDS